MPQVSFSTTTTFPENLNALVEDQGTFVTFRFDLNEPAPAGGLKIFVDSDRAGIISRLDIPLFISQPDLENIPVAGVGRSRDDSGLFVTVNQGATSGSGLSKTWKVIVPKVAP